MELVLAPITISLPSRAAVGIRRHDAGYGRTRWFAHDAGTVELRDHGFEQVEDGFEDGDINDLAFAVALTPDVGEQDPERRVQAGEGCRRC